MRTRSVLHGVRLVAATVAASVVACAVVGGLGSRVAMLVLRLLNDSHDGEPTHNNAVTGEVTVDGTLVLVGESLFFAPVVALLYLVVRRGLPSGRRGRALGAAAFGLAVGAPTIVDLGDYEYVRYTSPWISVPLFAVLPALAGAAVSLLAEWWGNGSLRRPNQRWLRILASLLVVILAGFGLLELAQELLAGRNLFL